MAIAYDFVVKKDLQHFWKNPNGCMLQPRPVMNKRRAVVRPEATLLLYVEDSVADLPLRDRIVSNQDRDCALVCMRSWE